jgi:muconolactone delta-isomerase
MLFLVISNPEPVRPSTVVENRKRYWPWAQALLDSGKAQSFYARTGRGAVAIFDVESNETLHALLNEWSEIVPAEFQIYPLISPDSIRQFLEK